MTTHDEHDHMPEGEEKAPPLTNTMAIVRWVILIGISLFALVMVLSYFDLTPWSTEEKSAVRYHCPMHPTYISNQPGDCPICGMSLVPMTNSADTLATPGASQMMQANSSVVAKPGQYSCPMHPEIVSDSPGRCTKCGMNLEQVKSETKTQYTCPMHPEVVSDTPGQCPKCGMDLVEMQHTDTMPSGHSMNMMTDVPGLATVAIEPQRLQLIGLRTGTVTMRSFGSFQKFPGYVTPDETKLATITSRVNGWVQKLLVNQTGQEVKKGEVLFTLYSQDLYQAEQDYLTAFNGMQKAANDQFIADTRKELLNAAKTRLQLLGLSDAELARLEKNDSASAKLPIVSPVTGVVLEKNVLPGQAIMPEQTLFTVADLSRIWVEVEVYEADLANIHVDQEATMTLASYPGDQFHGSVAFIYPTISPDTRTAKVRLQFQNPILKLKPGMFADVQLSGNNESVLSVPREAFMQDEGKSYVFVVHDGNHFQPRLVTAGKTNDEFVEIVSGLSDGETVVTSANFLIDSESRLKAALAGMGGTTNEHSGM